MFNPEIGSWAASEIAPQGQGFVAASFPNHAATEDEAKRPVPKGQAWIASPSVAELCGELMGLQRRRTFAIRQQSRCDRSTEAFIRTLLGYRTDLPDKERKRLSAEAVRIKNTIERGEDQNTAADPAIAPVVQACSMVVLQSAASRVGWDAIRTSTEAEMCRLAKQLPAWPFVKSVKGVSELGLAVIVGEAKDLALYPTHSHLWKRLGLSVMDGNRQGNPGKGASKDDWIAHGYVRCRRAEIYAFLDDVMFRSQWRGDKDADGKNPAKTKQPVAVSAHAIGPYGEAYGRKKAEYLAREWVPAHADNAARRYMAKKFIRDLWNAWRGADTAVPLGLIKLAPATHTEKELEQ